jgi:hypothetical protein
LEKSNNVEKFAKFQALLLTMATRGVIITIENIKSTYAGRGIMDLITKLNKVVKTGYTPSRGAESYNYVTKLGTNVSSLANCFEHACFNITNLHFDSCEISKKDAFEFGDFSIAAFAGAEYTKRELFHFVKKTGLDVSSCKPKSMLKNNEWMVALYFCEGDYCIRDFHFMLQEKDKSWSSKLGFEPICERFEDLPNTFACDYKLYGTYKISNPYKEK